MLSTSTINGITSRVCATPGVVARLTNRNEAAANAVVAVVMVPTTANEGTLNAGGSAQPIAAALRRAVCG